MHSTFRHQKPKPRRGLAHLFLVHGHIYVGDTMMQRLVALKGERDRPLTKPGRAA
jgi:hypothetical protein